MMIDGPYFFQVKKFFKQFSLLVIPGKEEELACVEYSDEPDCVDAEFELPGSEQDKLDEVAGEEQETSWVCV